MLIQVGSLREGEERRSFTPFRRKRQHFGISAFCTSGGENGGYYSTVDGLNEREDSLREIEPHIATRELEISDVACAVGI
jgi:hypothetical protein